MNYSALRKLPVVFLCENNLYATYSSQLKRQPADNIQEKVSAFGVGACSMFGNDVIAVYAAVEEAIRHARAGKGPSFVQAYTYRWCGHVGPEDDDYLLYRPKEELEFWKTHCPIALLEERMIASRLLTSATKATLVDEIDAEIADAFQFAKQSPFPRVTEWGALNFSKATPMADKLLQDSRLAEFDQRQAETVPAPY